MVVTNVEEINKYGLQLIRVDLPFRLNHVNCFLVEGEMGYTLIDTGLNNEQTRQLWHSHFKDKQLSEIIVTHEHPDHIGSAGYLQDYYGAIVRMTEDTYKFGQHFIKDERLTNLLKNYHLSGVPKEIVDQLIEANEIMKAAVEPLPKNVEFLTEDETIKLGQYDYEIILTPGHAEGIISLYNKDNRILISTDHILPRITPNISYWFYGDPNPLKSYIESLNKLRKLNADFVIPSHGTPFYDANKRIDEILKHHDDRLNETLTIIQNGGTVYDITNKMFAMKLTSHEMRFAIGETIAHLEYLRHEGKCIREEVNGLWHYTKK